MGVGRNFVRGGPNPAEPKFRGGARPPHPATLTGLKFDILVGKILFSNLGGGNGPPPAPRWLRPCYYRLGLDNQI